MRKQSQAKTNFEFSKFQSNYVHPTRSYSHLAVETVAPKWNLKKHGLLFGNVVHIQILWRFKCKRKQAQSR